MAKAAPSEHAEVKYKIHYHVILTHFPVSFFLVSAGFMILHLILNNPGFERSAYLTLTAGAIMMIPTTLTGWFTWKGHYKGARVKTVGQCQKDLVLEVLSCGEENRVKFFG